MGENLENASRSGRPKLTDARTDRQLLRVVKLNRRKTLREVTSVYNAQAPRKLSRSTVKRRLKFYGYKRRVVKKKIVISKVNRIRRRAWCRSKLHTTVNNYWKKNIFSDETQIVLGKNSNVHIWRRDDEKWAPRCLGEHADANHNVRASVMFWGCITYDGVGTLAVIDGNINSQNYIDILDTNLWPVIAKVFPAGQWIFQDDHAPPHVLRLTMNWKQANNITTMMWPAQSPDVKIIENFWEMDKYFTAKKISYN